jgi:hypothetical protein
LSVEIFSMSFFDGMIVAVRKVDLLETNDDLEEE